jgi:hypothetical protein
MIPGGLVERYGLRACPRGCAGRCQLATEDARGRVAPSPDCALMSGAPPMPGRMPPLTHHSAEQLRGLVDEHRRFADPDITRAALAELERRGLAP